MPESTPDPIREPMRFLLVQLEEAGRRRRAAVPDWSAADEFDTALAVLHADHDESLGAASPMVRLADVFNIDQTEAALLWSVVAPDLDATVGLAYGLLRGTSGPARPTVGLVLELAGVPTATPEAFGRLGADAPLRRHRLIELSTAEPWLSRHVIGPDPVVGVLAGGWPYDAAVRHARTDLVPLEVAGVDTLARAIEQGTSLAWIRSPAGQSGTAMAAGAFRSLGLHCLAIDLRRRDPAHSASDLVAAAAREAGLRGWGLAVVGCEEVDAKERAVFAILDRAVVPVVAVSTQSWNPAWLDRFPLLLDAAPLSASDRAVVWREHLGDEAYDDPDLHSTLLGLRLSGEDVAEASRYAAVLAAARDEKVGPDVVREAARRVGGTGRGGADRVAATSAGRSRPTFADLVLPDHIAGSLRQLVSWAQHRDTLGTKGILSGRSRGISALFTGNPGTGKTLAAHVIAEELAIDLFQVDLSSIVDKYIGETEKNLERVFQAAEALDVVLFFDEADALFGSRSEVSDAKDRYANQEVAYLLQRMENFDGITVLSTNLRGNLDRAFSRRMNFIIHFPDPDQPTRVRLWQQHLDMLDAIDPADPVAVDEIATAAELAGGEVRNIVLSAAYDAAGENVPVGNRHVVDAAVREYHKLGRVVPDSGFRSARAAAIANGLRRSPVAGGHPE